MKPEIVLEYSTDGAPLLIADVASAALWRGAQDDGSGAIVEYMARGLPKELMASKKIGMQQKKFKSLALAEVFAKELLTKLRKLHPKARPLPAGSAFYYNGDERVFSIELKYTSQLSSIADGLKGGAQCVKLDKKTGAQAVFMAQDGGGPGVLVVDRAASVLAIAQLSGDANVSASTTALAKLKIPSAKAKLALDGRIAIFDAEYAAAEIAQLNWKTDDFAKGAEAAFAKSAHGPLRIRDQKAPCVGFVQLEPGKYEMSYDGKLVLAKSYASALWLRRV